MKLTFPSPGTSASQTEAQVKITHPSEESEWVTILTKGDLIPLSKIHDLNPGGPVNTSLKKGLESFWANFIFFLALQQTVHISYNIKYFWEKSIKFLLMNIPLLSYTPSMFARWVSIFCRFWSTLVLLVTFRPPGVQIVTLWLHECLQCPHSCVLLATGGRDTDTWTRNQRPPQLSLFHNWGGRRDKK